jgi:hypothetical protein
LIRGLGFRRSYDILLAFGLSGLCGRGAILSPTPDFGKLRTALARQENCKVRFWLALDPGRIFTPLLATQKTPRFSRFALQISLGACVGERRRF